jgi:hypothetical protein
MPLIETKGAASAQGFGLTLQQTAVNYIEDVFSTWLYSGNGSTQTITNGIDLAGKGGLVWIKGRTGSAADHLLFDTARGATNALITNGSGVTFTNANTLSAFNASGFSVGSYVYVNGGPGGAPTFPETFVSWTFREQPKFFDVVTYTGTGSATTIAHNLGSVPGCIIVKRTDSTGNWTVYHRSLTSAAWFLDLNSTNAADIATGYWNSTAPTSTVFSVGASTVTNASGGTYVAYLFAHDAGGFGLTGTDNVISCGSFTTNSGGNATVNLGYEPQWLMVKNTSSSENWYLVDNMRSWPVDHSANRAAFLYPNLSNPEGNLDALAPTSTGFTAILGNTQTYIYIAIRRGPMKTPTTGTSVFSPVTQTSTANQLVTTNFPVDLLWTRTRASFSVTSVFDRLRGSLSTGAVVLNTNSANGESSTGSYGFGFDNNTGVTDNYSYGALAIYWNFRRAPGFCDVVCYTGTGSATTFSHNLGVVPELMMVKRRDLVSANWFVYDTATGNTKYQVLNNTATPTTSSAAWNNTTPTSTVFSVGTDISVNTSAGTYVAYLFASCPGVSKVGSYTGTAALLTVNCGFTGGARFVLIKRTDGSTVAGDWWVYDSARGISSGNDPYLLLNSTSPEVTGTNYVDTTSVGFQVTAAAPAGLNANGGTYIFLAIA